MNRESLKLGICPPLSCSIEYRVSFSINSHIFDMTIVLAVSQYLPKFYIWHPLVHINPIYWKKRWWYICVDTLVTPEYELKVTGSVRILVNLFFFKISSIWWTYTPVLTEINCDTHDIMIWCCWQQQHFGQVFGVELCVSSCNNTWIEFNSLHAVYGLWCPDPIRDTQQYIIKYQRQQNWQHFDNKIYLIMWISSVMSAK